MTARNLRQLGSAALVIGALIVSMVLAKPHLSAATPQFQPALPDPSDSAVPSAEVIHVVSQETWKCLEGSSSCQPGADLGTVTTETWIDQISGDVAVTTTDEAGHLRQAIIRYGIILTECSFGLRYLRHRA